MTLKYLDPDRLGINNWGMPCIHLSSSARAEVFWKGRTAIFMSERPAAASLRPDRQ